MAEARIPTGTPPGGNGQRPVAPWEPARGAASSGTAAPADQPALEGHSVHALQQVKGRGHRKLLERLNLSNLDRLERQQGE